MPACDYEIGHVNIATPATGRAVVDWHQDAYPFVVILILSNLAPGTVGGETLVRTRAGPDLAIRCPARGHAVVLQGGHIRHKALPVVGGSAERITMVTSFRPRDPFVRMDVRLGTVRPVSDLRRLYHEYVEYRLEALRRRVVRQQERLGLMGPKGFDTNSVKAGLRELRETIERTETEVVDEDLIRRGVIEV